MPFIVIDEFASIVLDTVPLSDNVTAVPEILVFDIAAEADMSESTIVPSAIIAEVIVPFGAENVPVNEALLIGAYDDRFNVDQEADEPSVVRYFPEFPV